MAYGKIEVKNIGTSQFADYVIRTFTVVNTKGSTESRVVRQFHFMSWPTNREVPLHATSFLDFMLRVQLWRPDSSARTVRIILLNLIRKKMEM